MPEDFDSFGIVAHARVAELEAKLAWYERAVEFIYADACVPEDDCICCQTFVQQTLHYMGRAGVPRQSIQSEDK